MLQFRGSVVTSQTLADARTGKDERHALVGLLPAKLIGDKGYDSDGVRNDRAERASNSSSHRDRTTRRQSGLQAAQPHRAVRQSPQAIPAHSTRYEKIATSGRTDYGTIRRLRS
jgi:hypothetical protein